MRVSTGTWFRARMATPFQERSPCQTASYPRVRRAFTGKASCSALSSWRLTTSGSAFANQARRLSSRLLMLLMLKVATFSGSPFPTLEVPALNGLYILETRFLEVPRDALPLDCATLVVTSAETRPGAFRSSSHARSSTAEQTVAAQHEPFGALQCPIGGLRARAGAKDILVLGPNRRARNEIAFVRPGKDLCPLGDHPRGTFPNHVFILRRNSLYERLRDRCMREEYSHWKAEPRSGHLRVLLFANADRHDGSLA